MTIFVVFLIIGFPIYEILNLFLGKKALKYQLLYNRFWSLVWGFLTGVRFKHVNRQIVEPNKAYVLVTNHTGLSDALAINAIVPTYYSPLAKIEVGKIPIMGRMFKQTSTLVDRKDKASRKKSLVEITRKASENISVLLFPEGTRNKTGEQPLLPFHNGAFRTAVASQLPILPFVLIGTRDMLTNDKLPLHPCKITAIFSEPIPTANLSEEDVPELRDKVYAIMEKLLLAHDPLYKNR